MSNLMIVNNLEQLKTWIAGMAVHIEKNEVPDPNDYAYFLEAPEFPLALVDLIQSMEDEAIDDDRAYYSACIFALDICVAQLQSAAENHHKVAAKTLEALMDRIAQAIAAGKHTLGFWLPILNAFYEVQVELSDALKDAYFDLASEEEITSPEDELSHLNAIRELLHDLSDLSDFDIAENFFAQSYAMPPDFYMDLLIDLYSIDEGQNIGLLALLHPKFEVREVVLETLDELFERVTLTPLSLSRLQQIKNWYPQSEALRFSRWIKKQRLNGVVFQTHEPAKIVGIKASEVDGSGAQGLFIHIKEKGHDKLCGLLFKASLGIKDTWMTPNIEPDEVARYYEETFDENVTLRSVDVAYLVQMTNHFLAVMRARGDVPDLHLLDIQEKLGLHFHPELLDVKALTEDFAIQIMPFTQEVVEASLNRSKLWPKSKQFTESWFIENANVDTLVNRSASFVDGVKVCRFEEAIAAVFKEELEKHRDEWLFHFLWIALWLKVNSRKNEKTWKDSFFIAYAIQSGRPLDQIPIMHEICYQSVVNSIETMEDRRTHLNQAQA